MTLMKGDFFICSPILSSYTHFFWIVFTVQMLTLLKSHSLVLSNIRKIILLSNLYSFHMQQFKTNISNLFNFATYFSFKTRLFINSIFLNTVIKNLNALHRELNRSLRQLKYTVKTLNSGKLRVLKMCPLLRGVRYWELI